MFKSFLFHLKNCPSKDVTLKFHLKLSSCVDVQSNSVYLFISYCVNLMVTIISHVFINIFQTEQFTTVKFAMGYEKIMSFLLIPKSPKVSFFSLKVETEAIKLGSFKSVTILTSSSQVYKAARLNPKGRAVKCFGH